MAYIKCNCHKCRFKLCRYSLSLSIWHYIFITSLMFHLSIFILKYQNDINLYISDFYLYFEISKWHVFMFLTSIFILKHENDINLYIFEFYLILKYENDIIFYISDFYLYLKISKWHKSLYFWILSLSWNMKMT